MKEEQMPKIDLGEYGTIFIERTDKQSPCVWSSDCPNVGNEEIHKCDICRANLAGEKTMEEAIL